MKVKRYSLEQRQALIAQWDACRADGGSTHECAKQLGISDKSIYMWKKAASVKEPQPSQAGPQIELYTAKRPYVKRGRPAGPVIPGSLSDDLLSMLETMDRCVKTGYQLYAKAIKAEIK